MGRMGTVESDCAWMRTLRCLRVCVRYTSTRCDRRRLCRLRRRHCAMELRRCGYVRRTIGMRIKLCAVTCVHVSAQTDP